METGQRQISQERSDPYLKGYAAEKKRKRLRLKAQPYRFVLLLEQFC
jgi:hypothetical protein